MDGLVKNVREATKYIQKNLVKAPDIGLVLGSGLGGAAQALEPEAELAYDQIPHFPLSKVEGHKGKLLLCRQGKKTVLALQGRFHYYEGYTMRGVTFPIRVLSELGVGKIILTNASGGLRSDLSPGDFMIVTDHINFMGDNPLIGVVPADSGTPFVDLRQAYDPEMVRLAETSAERLSLKPAKGVLAAVSGPSYETRAEARLLASSGADAVTMSTIPETIVARQTGMKVMAVSCVTNSLWQESGIGHGDVVATGERASSLLGPWLKEIVKSL